MKISTVKCSNCHNKFNYEFIGGASFHAIRLWNRRIFKCPICKALRSFNIADRGSDPTLPTYRDNSQTDIGRRIWGLMIGPSLALIAIGLLSLVILISSPYFLLFLVPILGGTAWTPVYIYYLNKRLGK